MGEERLVVTLFKSYAESHQNPTNKLIHWVCVPLIFFSIFSMIACIPTPQFLLEVSPYLNWMNIILILVLCYYIRLSFPLFLVFAGWTLIVSFGNAWLLIKLGSFNLLLSALATFILAWVGQFIGHTIEGKKPSFLEDLQFLLIGPAWLFNFIFKIVKY